MNKQVQKALALAINSHFGQNDKCGQDYILHPIRVSQSFTGYNEKIVALLHDVVEDTEVTLGEIEEKFNTMIALAVESLTHRKGEAYNDYIERVKLNPLATIVKIADITDNLDPSRQYKGRNDKRYKKALEKLKQIC